MTTIIFQTDQPSGYITIGRYFRWFFSSQMTTIIFQTDQPSGYTDKTLQIDIYLLDQVIVCNHENQETVCDCYCHRRTVQTLLDQILNTVNGFPLFGNNAFKVCTMLKFVHKRQHKVSKEGRDGVIERLTNLQIEFKGSNIQFPRDARQKSVKMALAVRQNGPNHLLICLSQRCKHYPSIFQEHLCLIIKWDSAVCK